MKAPTGLPAFTCGTCDAGFDDREAREAHFDDTGHGVRRAAAARAPQTPAGEDLPKLRILASGRSALEHPDGRIELIPKGEADPPARPAPAKPDHRPNRYGGKCARCGVWIEPEAGKLVGQAGAWGVEHLEACPEKPARSTPTKHAGSPQHDVPAGHYATPSRTGNNDLDFWRVDRPTEGDYAGRTFVKRVIGGKPDHNVRGTEQRQALEAIALDVEKAGLAYAERIGRCRRCNRHLTVKASRDRGYGPECITLV